VGWTSSRKTGGSTPLLARWNGSGWRTVVNPALDSTLLHKGLTGVSCATTMSCVAVGTAYGRPSTRVRPLLATWDGTAWTTGSLPQRFGSSGVDQLDAVSCSVSHCAAVGAFHEGTDSNTLGWSGTVPRRSVDASWNAVDAARVRQLAAELRLTPAGLQKAAVYALAFVIGGASGPPTKVALPSGHTVATFTTVWDPSEFTIIDSVRERYGVDSSDATRIAVIVLSFVYALRGR
jgi:hypothetical protein